jgi:hypothetical protein
MKGIRFYEHGHPIHRYVTLTESELNAIWELLEKEKFLYRDPETLEVEYPRKGKTYEEIQVAGAEFFEALPEPVGDEKYRAKIRKGIPRVGRIIAVFPEPESHLVVFE